MHGKKQKQQQHHGKVLLGAFHFKGRNLRFHPQAQKLQQNMYNIIHRATQKYCLIANFPEPQRQK